MEAIQLYRKRYMPMECIALKDDKILYSDDEILVTEWKTIHPKTVLDHGSSCYYWNQGYKISRFCDKEDKLLYWYCDIIEHERDGERLVVTDLLADVILYPDGTVKVVDIGELGEALEQGILTTRQMVRAMKSLDALLNRIYEGTFPELLKPLEVSNADYI